MVMEGRMKSYVKSCREARKQQATPVNGGGGRFKGKISQQHDKIRRTRQRWTKRVY